MDLKINFEKPLSFRAFFAPIRTKKEILMDLASRLTSITNEFCLPWIQIARKESVNIEAESEILKYAQIDAMQHWEKSKSNHEPMLVRLIVIRKECTYRILKKVYQKRINDSRESVKEKAGENSLIVDQLAEEALIRIQKILEQRWQKVSKKCERIFFIFEGNLSLLIENPEAYNRLADIEFVKRQILFRAKILLRYENNLFRISRINELKDRALLELFSEEKELGPVIERIENAFHELERCLAQKPHPKICGSFAYVPEKK